MSEQAAPLVDLVRAHCHSFRCRNLKVSSEGDLCCGEALWGRKNTLLRQVSACWCLIGL